MPAADGTTRLQGGARLEEGDSYTIAAYAPNPTKEQMENAPRGYRGDMVRYTAMQLPLEGESATEGVALQGDAAREAAAGLRETIFFPLRDEPVNTVTEEAEPAIRNSPYARMYAEAQRLTADASSSYAAVKNVERYLQESFSYAERVPTRPIPLMGFLYEDERGYCQQFSGAMALMLRMSGIPARVAAGFSPGSYNKDTDEYRVRDLDAHSWVEVWFTGIGWVPFDPTPARSPAASQSSALATSAAAADAGEADQTRLGVAGERGTDTGAALQSEGDGGGALVPVLLILLVAGPLAVRRRCSWPCASGACASSPPPRWPTRSSRSSGARSCGSAGTCPPRPRCSRSSGGSAASPARRRRRTPARSARTATTRARRRRPACGTAARCGGSSRAGACSTGCGGSWRSRPARHAYRRLREDLPRPKVMGPSSLP